jgi:hypothetical protein
MRIGISIHNKDSFQKEKRNGKSAPIFSMRRQWVFAACFLALQHYEHFTIPQGFFLRLWRGMSTHGERRFSA